MAEDRVTYLNRSVKELREENRKFKPKYEMVVQNYTEKVASIRHKVDHEL